MIGKWTGRDRPPTGGRLFVDGAGLSCADGEPMGRLALGNVTVLPARDELPEPLQQADMVAMWEGVDEANECWLLACDAAFLRSVTHPADEGDADIPLIEAVNLPMVKTASAPDVLPAEKFYLLCLKSTFDRTPFRVPKFRVLGDV